jgi:uncharacterized membrane protein
MMDDFALARALHVLALVHWIGGVAMVTTIVLPRARVLTNARAPAQIMRPSISSGVSGRMKTHKDRYQLPLFKLHLDR